MLLCGSEVDSTKTRNESKVPMRTVKQSGVGLGVLVAADCTTESLVDFLKRFSHRVRLLTVSINAIVDRYNYTMTFGRIA